MPDVVSAPIGIINLPDNLCVSSLKDFLVQLPQWIVALIPTSITNVVVGNVQPLDSQRDSLWLRQNNSGIFIGFYVFSGGTWVQIFPMPNQIFPRWRATTDPTAPPTGYTRIDNVAGVPAAVVTQLQTQWVVDAGNPGFYLRDDNLYTGA